MPGELKSAVESYYPGRIRVRLPREHRNEQTLSEIGSLVRGVEGISNIYTNIKTGSVLVEYDPETVDVEKMIALGGAAGLIAGAGEAIMEGVEALTWLGPSLSARRVLNGMKKFDWRIHRATRGAVDAKMAVPLVLLLWSLGRVLLSEQRTPTPWHALMWYSYSVFVQWNKPAHAAGSAELV